MDSLNNGPSEGRFGRPGKVGLYDPSFEHDACGVGFICHIKGKASNKIVVDALTILENMNHRGACGCEPDSGDGAGILVRTPDKFLRREAKKLGINLPAPGHGPRVSGKGPPQRWRDPRAAAGVDFPLRIPSPALT